MFELEEILVLYELSREQTISEAEKEKHAYFIGHHRDKKEKPNEVVFYGICIFKVQRPAPVLELKDSIRRHVLGILQVFYEERGKKESELLQLVDILVLYDLSHEQTISETDVGSKGFVVMS
ncbi:hypothetical protein CDAR_176181 [Caerostris darwini]|uniref:Uncharacterized protein n=1 Tax=Caerostris darwini TaxID=1538125 RepID=A0AAV4NZR8_9ARAC|nr:hypothetical protein CDAR_176181 [Caerostris darwini]